LFELEKGLVLRDLVVEILRAGPKSISQVGAALKERGLKLHRLAVAGYLKALADEDVLEEREIPPAKVYAVKPGAAGRDLYRRISEHCREHAEAGTDGSRLFLQVLTDLFRRPIFQEELRRGGYEAVPDAQEVAGEERQAARRALSRSTLKLPFNDPAFRPRPKNEADGRSLRERAHHVLADIVLEEYRAAALAVTTRQATLGGDA
jgi:hypothetical protein